MRKVGEVGMKKDYIVELREEEADELMDDHWVGELIRCKDCKKRYTVHCIQEEAGNINNQDDWFCADGERRTEWRE